MRIVRRSSLILDGLLALIVGGGLAVIGVKATPLGVWPGVLGAGILLWYRLKRSLRRWRVAQQPFSGEHRAWLLYHVPYYNGLGRDGRRRFERDVKFVLDEWLFEGVQGVEVTDELRLAVAAGVAVMLHTRPDWELPAHQSVLFYPGSFDEEYKGGEEAYYDGMAHTQGPVILTARAVEEGWADPRDGSNVVLHELAHLFDFDDAFADGVPSLMSYASADAWQRLMREEMHRARMGKSILRRYAAESPAELFAVAVENYFERPDVLRANHPELHQALEAFFRG